jgi:peptidoglycan/LPS O-acetylase OafA/YrhL
VVILQAFLALLAGYATMAALVILITLLITRLAPAWMGKEGAPQSTYIAVNIGYSLLAAAAGGYVTALIAQRFARGNPLIQVLALALIVLLLAALSAMQSRGKQPIWYQLTLVAIVPLGVFAGGVLRLRIVGIL